MKKPRNNKVICPYCGCEEWEIGSMWFKCFLCKVTFGGKEVLQGTNINRINQQLQRIKSNNEEFNNFFKDFYKDDEDE